MQKIFNTASGTNIETNLGLQVQQYNDKTNTIKKPGLLNKVIMLCGLDNESNKHLTPSDIILQHPMPIVEPR
jgi:hypothetical protein